MLPIVLTCVTFLVLTVLLSLFLHVLNTFPLKEKIQIIIRPIDILVGVTIYLKTSIDFALFMGNLMQSNPGWKKRIAIEIGTALGNALGTFVVLCIWYFFKQAPALLIIIIILASLTLLQMAEEGFEQFLHQKNTRWLQKEIKPLYFLLEKINHVFSPLFSRVIPHKEIMKPPSLSFIQLLLFALAIPFLLGLDDFAGYIPLFTIVNVFSFVIGVFFAHMLLNIGLFAYPSLTTKITKHPLVIVGGSIVFVGLALWGLYEAFEILVIMVF